MPANQYREAIEQMPETSEKAPEPTEVKFSLEKEILELEKKLAEKKAEISKEKAVEKEPVKEKAEIAEKEKEKAVPSPALPPPTAPPAQIRQQVKDLQSLDRQNQVKILSDLAFQKGLDFAIQVARGLDNAYVLDEFHDTLVDELYKKLVEEGKLKKF